jgi:hypothetical protein
MPRYIVTAKDKFPAAGETPSTYEIDAKTKADAIKEAKKRAGWRSRHDSPVIYTAIKDE